MHRRAHLASLGFTVIFGFSFMFTKISLEYIDPLGLVSYRYLTAFLFIEIGRRFGFFEIVLTREKLRMMALIVLFQPIGNALLSTYGLTLISSGEAMMLVALIPVFAALGSTLILKEAPRLKQVLFMLISISGIVYIQVSLQGLDRPSSLLGFLLVLGAVLCGAAYNVGSRFASRSMRAMELTYFMMFAGAITFNGLYGFTLLLSGELTQYVVPLCNLSLLMPVLYLGALSSLVAFFLLNYAFSQLPAHVVGIYANLVTVIGIFAGVFLLDETIYGFHLIGSGLIIIGVYGTISSAKDPEMMKKTL